MAQRFPNVSDAALLRSVYGIAAQNMQAAGKEMPCAEEMFLTLSMVDPEGTSYRQLEHLNNAEFLEAAYMLLLGRPIDPGAKAARQSQLDMEQTAFRTMLLKAILHSEEYRMHGIPLRDCPLPIAENGLAVTVNVSGPAVPERVMRLYHAMPQPLKKIAKKIAGRGGA